MRSLLRRAQPTPLERSDRRTLVLHPSRLPTQLTILDLGTVLNPMTHSGSILQLPEDRPKVGEDIVKSPHQIDQLNQDRITTSLLRRRAQHMSDLQAIVRMPGLLLHRPPHYQAILLSLRLVCLNHQLSVYLQIKG